MLQVLQAFPLSPVVIILPVGQPCEHLGIQLSRVLVPLLLGVRLEKEELDYLLFDKECRKPRYFFYYFVFYTLMSILYRSFPTLDIAISSPFFGFVSEGKFRD